MILWEIHKSISFRSDLRWFWIFHLDEWITVPVRSMVYLPTFTPKISANVDKYTTHGSYGVCCRFILSFQMSLLRGVTCFNTWASPWKIAKAMAARDRISGTAIGIGSFSERVRKNSCTKTVNSTGRWAKNTTSINALTTPCKCPTKNGSLGLLTFQDHPRIWI